ncbi:MAG: DNA polymerase, partial [Candidatus Thorarchaeota archaeon]
FPTPWGIPAVPIYHPSWLLRQGSKGTAKLTWESQWERLVRVFNEDIPELKEYHKLLTTPMGIRDFYREELLPACRAGKKVAYDYETTGLNPWESEFRLVGYSIEGEIGIVHPLRERYQRMLHRSFLKKCHDVILHHGIFDMTFAQVHKLPIPTGTIIDTKVLSFLVDEAADHSLEKLVSIYLPELSGYKGETEEKGITRIGLPDEVWARRCGIDCVATYRLAEILSSKLEKSQIQNYIQIMGPALKTISRCRARGWKVDLLKLGRKVGEAATEKAKLIGQLLRLPESKQIAGQLNGKTLNLNSNQHRPLLLKAAGIDDPFERQPNNPSLMKTGKNVLMKHAGKHAVVDLLIQYDKSRSTLTKFYGPAWEKLKDRTEPFLYPGYNFGGRVSKEEAGGTVTGRLSAATSHGFDNLLNPPPEFREVFVSRFTGGSLLAADYSQLELRIVASLANEKDMIEGFIRGEDPHQITADVIVPKKMTSRLQMSDKDRRHIGKTFNFALVYGAGGFRLASLLGWDQHDHHKVVRAEELISQFWKKRPAVRRFMANMKMAALTEGVVKGVVGMHLHCPDATDSNPKARAHAMRRVGNFPVQNAGAILTLRAMTRIDEELLKRKLSRS